MPSSTPKQARTMAAAAHDSAFAKKMGIPQSVAREYNAADAGTGILKRVYSRRGTARAAKKKLRIGTGGY